MRFCAASRPSRISVKSRAKSGACSFAVASSVIPFAIESSFQAGQARLLSASVVLCKSEAKELPTISRIEETSVGRADVLGPGRARAAADDHLIAHEFAVVFAEGAGERLEARVGRVRRRRPFPDVAVELADSRLALRVVGGFGIRCRMQQP